MTSSAGVGTVAPLLAVEGVSKRFGRVVTATEVSFHVGHAEVLGVVGPNGAGKSTMLDMLHGTQPVDAGRVLLDGRDVTGLGAAARGRLGVARTYQVPRPFGGLTVFENVLVGARFAARAGRRRAAAASWQALETTGLADLANHRADGLRLMDRKRLELARALATGPRVILLDEIAGGLTDSELPELVALVAGLRDAGTSVVWIEHIVHALLQVVDRLMCLAMGEVVASGDPHEVMASPEVVDVYLGAVEEEAS